ncbi:MAG: hypothetical protein JKY52_20395 [Flavobacteriales bacterium]|nr:hypothetical protein [Flavobacteriales bacterium]
MENWDIVLLTEKRYINATKGDEYVLNVLREQELVQNALEAKGLNVTRANWADPSFDWASTKAVLFREIWDYHHRFAEFSPWLEATAAKTQMINTAAQIRWNLDKHYLGDLADQGVNVCSTRFIEIGERCTLQQIREQEKLEDFVLKPAISGGGRHTYRLSCDSATAHEGIFKDLIANESMLIQPFQQNILKKGEVALMVFGGKYSHAILKIAKEGEFRVQDDFGGSVQMYHPSEEEIAFAEDVVAKTDPLPAYARVDVIWDNDEQLAVTELELIEPELWFRFKPEAADLFAEAVVSVLNCGA